MTTRPTAAPRCSFTVARARSRCRPGSRLNTVELTVPKSEFAKFNGNCNQTGQICLFLSDPAIPDVNLYGWSVMYVEDGLIAMQPGDSMPSVQEKIIGLADRRWEFTGGRGGFITKPKFNAQNADGTYGAPGGPALSSAYLMAVALVNKMTFVSGQPSMGPGDIPEAGPILTTTPYDAVWENAAHTDHAQRSAGAVRLHVRPEGQRRL